MNTMDLYREWRQPASWRHAVVCYWERHVAAERTQRVSPDGFADLLTYESGRVEVAGIADEVALPLLPAGTRIQGIRFRPEAIATLFSIDASRLRNTTVGLDDIIGA